MKLNAIVAHPMHGSKVCLQVGPHALNRLCVNLWARGMNKFRRVGRVVEGKVFVAESREI